MNRYEKEGLNTIRIQSPMGDRQIVTELAEDFSLPDYQPEIKRLLRVKATVSPADKYIGAGSAECSGTVDYCILYSGNDGGLYCTNQTGEYRFTAPVELPADFEIGEGFLCDVESVPEMTSGRVVAPRKLSVKCRLRSRMRLYGTRLLGENVGDGEDVQRLHGQTACARVFLGAGEPIALGDEILCDAKDRNVRVICAEGQVFVTEAAAGSGSVNCRGELCLKLLCCHDDAEEPELPYSVLRRIPFGQQVPAEGVEVNCDCCARGTCTDIRITVEEGRILCEASVSLQVRAQRNEDIAYTRDLYSTGRECETAYTTVALQQALRCVNGNFSLNTAIPLEEAGIRPGLAVADISGTAAVTGLEADRGKYFLTGKCRFLVILSDNGELSAQEFEAPFRYETDGGKEAPTDSDITVELISCKAKIDGERIGVDAELAVAAAIRGQSRICTVSEASFGGEWKAAGAVYTVCYPARDDTLWSVARRYHCPVSDLVARNSLASAPAADSPDSLAGVRFLLV